MKIFLLFLLVSSAMTLSGQQAPAAAQSPADDMKTRVAQLEQDRATLAKNKEALKELEKQVDDLKKKIKLQEDTIKLQQKRIENLKKLGEMK